MNRFSIIAGIFTILSITSLSQQKGEGNQITPKLTDEEIEKLFADPLPKDAYHLTLNCDTAFPDAIYIPSDIYDAIKELDKMLTPEFKAYFRSTPMDRLFEFHFGIGLWMRNYWGLWANSRLYKYFESMGLFHPDDISSTILQCYWRHLNGAELCLQELVSYYQEYWQNYREEVSY